jgi:hypothetical protein
MLLRMSNTHSTRGRPKGRVSHHISITLNSDLWRHASRWAKSQQGLSLSGAIADLLAAASGYEPKPRPRFSVTTVARA